MRTSVFFLGLVLVVIGLFVLIAVPDIVDRYWRIEVRPARTTMEPVSYVDTLAYGTQWPDFVGNSMLMVGLIIAVIGLAGHNPAPRQ